MRATIGQSLNVAGIQFQQQWTREASGVLGKQVVLPVAKDVGTSWDAGEVGEGTATLPDTDWDNQGFIRFDAYWDGGRRYGCTGSVSGTALTITGGGEGDSFPADSTPMIFARPIEIITLFDGDNVKVFGSIIEFAAGGIGARGIIDVREAASSAATFGVRGNIPTGADVEGGETNPFAGDNDIEETFISHADTTASAVAKFGLLIDATP